jgi:hypothetical protein
MVAVRLSRVERRSPQHRAAATGKVHCAGDFADASLDVVAVAGAATPAVQAPAKQRDRSAGGEQSLAQIVLHF